MKVYYDNHLKLCSKPPTSEEIQARQVVCGDWRNRLVLYKEDGGFRSLKSWRSENKRGEIIEYLKQGFVVKYAQLVYRNDRGPTPRLLNLGADPTETLKGWTEKDWRKVENIHEHKSEIESIVAQEYCKAAYPARVDPFKVSSSTSYKRGPLAEAGDSSAQTPNEGTAKRIAQSIGVPEGLGVARQQSAFSSPIPIPASAPPQGVSYSALSVPGLPAGRPSFWSASLPGQQASFEENSLKNIYIILRIINTETITVSMLSGYLEMLNEYYGMLRDLIPGYRDLDVGQIQTRAVEFICSSTSILLPTM